MDRIHWLADYCHSVSDDPLTPKEVLSWLAAEGIVDRSELIQRIWVLHTYESSDYPCVCHGTALMASAVVFPFCDWQ